jgi:hypothetical protein
MRRRLAELRPQNGAGEAAAWVQELAVAAGRRSGPPPGAVERPARFGSWARAWVFVRTLPRTLTRLARQTVAPAGPRVLVLAFGADEGAIRGALGRAAEPPERILLVTDSLAIGDVWRAGTGVEHVPGAGERQAELAGTDYAEFRRRRLGLILAGRPRLGRAIAVGEVPGDLVAAATAPRRHRARLLS